MSLTIRTRTNRQGTVVTVLDTAGEVLLTGGCTSSAERWVRRHHGSVPVRFDHGWSSR